MEKKIFMIRPVVNHSVQGRHLHETILKGFGQGDIRKSLNKNKAVNKGTGKSCVEVFPFARLSSNRNMYDTGLNEQIKNPFFFPKVENKEEVANQIISEQNLDATVVKQHLVELMTFEKITYQQYYEIKFNLEKGSLHSKVSTERLKGLKSVVDPAAKPTLVSEFRIVLYDQSNIFDTSTLKGALSWHWSQKYPVVAKFGEPVNGATHRWYVAKENEELQKTLDLHDLENEAIAKLVFLKKKYPISDVLDDNILFYISSVTKYKGKPIIRGKQKAVTILEKINNHLKPTDKADLRENVESFLEATNLFETNSEFFYVTYLVQQAENNNLVTQNNGAFYWLSQKLKRPESYKFESIERFRQFLLGELSKDKSEIWEYFIQELVSNDIIVPKNLQ